MNMWFLNAILYENVYEEHKLGRKCTGAAEFIEYS